MGKDTANKEISGKKMGNDEKQGKFRLCRDVQ